MTFRARWKGIWSSLRAGSSYEGMGGNTLSAHCDSLVRKFAGRQQIPNIVHREHE
jgi:hypothetical protein